MQIRVYQPGDEGAQAEVYNAAARSFPKFKPATAGEVIRRCQAPDFDPGTRFYAEENGKVVAYATFLPNGRVSYPWCLAGYESTREPLFDRVLQALKQRGIGKAFAAYRADWPEPLGFFRRNGFQPVREMVNFALPLADMPTRAVMTSATLPLQPADVPAIFNLAPHALRCRTPKELEQHLYHNAHFAPTDCFVLRNRKDLSITACGILVINNAYADPLTVDPGMPCFRLGAFGTEDMQTKRINGLFSYITRDDGEATQNAVRLLEFAAERLEEAEFDTLAAQVPSDVPHLFRFYRQQFQRQGAFPILETAIT